ncbi:MAG: enoyl-CoA hydratase-related protein [Acetobacteraceae bacterium]|nr:enoyl-CoA hydratase-related protein [Acetobacteraceae bacterium]MCX7686331.1 enoyl-CoA hydratase-related protein [Acetobacteraceae bacterium]MDW8399041.1 enoyl-CoA hydratase-related protein [Acetobacteraceae bacterium]
MSGSVLFALHEGGVALLTLNRPDARNAIDDALREALAEAVERAADPAVRALVLTGAPPAFCAGGDLKAMAERLAAPPGQVAAAGWQRQQALHRLILRLHRLPKPTIAAVNGAAAGLGCDLALACDFVLAAEDARFAFSFLARGLVPDGGGPYFLPRRVGLARAKEIVFSARTVGAAEALAIGLADRLAPPDRLLEEALAWARSLSAGSPAAIALAKTALERSLETPPETLLALASQSQAICYTTEEHRAAVEAFLSGRR